MFSVSAETIKLGMSAALTGPSAALGNNMRSGIDSYFSVINDKGGVRGRQLEFIVRDDGYEPERAADNMRKLIDDNGVLALLGNVGTPTALLTVPIANAKKTLLFGAFTGGGVLRVQPASRYIINYRPSYDEETSEMISGLLNIGIKPDEIGFFTQRDGYGDAAFNGAINALQQHGFRNSASLVHGRYTRNTLNIEDAIVSILDAEVTPKVIIMAGGYAPSAKFIKLIKQDLPDLWFINVSFVGSFSLQKELEGNDSHVIITQVVPEINASLPIVEEYLSALHEFNPALEANEISLEGFIVAKVFHQGLLNIEGEITKESIIKGLEGINDLDIGLGLNINYNKLEHQAIHQLWVTTLANGKVMPFSWEMMLDEGVSNE